MVGDRPSGVGKVACRTVFSHVRMKAFGLRWSGMELVYRLKDDPKHIAQVQKATLTTDNFGVEPTHGLFGSSEWSGRIATEHLLLHTLRPIFPHRFLSDHH